MPGGPAGSPGHDSRAILLVTRLVRSVGVAALLAVRSSNAEGRNPDHGRSTFAFAPFCGLWTPNSLIFRQQHRKISLRTKVSAPKFASLRPPPPSRSIGAQHVHSPGSLLRHAGDSLLTGSSDDEVPLNGYTNFVVHEETRFEIQTPQDFHQGRRTPSMNVMYPLQAAAMSDRTTFTALFRPIIWKPVSPPSQVVFAGNGKAVVLRGPA